ncbi:hypothetical protein ACVTW2_000666 [Escherichia coli]
MGKVLVAITISESIIAMLHQLTGHEQMTTKQLNATALANSARECIGYAQSTKWTITKIVNHWNLCVEQSGLTGSYDFPTDYKRKAHLIADLERCVEQLTNIAEGRDALVSAPVETVKAEISATIYTRREYMVQDIQKGMVVVNPVSGEHNTVNYVDDFSCYFIISFSGDMHQQYFDRGETLMVCEPVEGSQILDVIPDNEDLNMNVYETLAAAIINDVHNRREDLPAITDEVVAGLANVLKASVRPHSDVHERAATAVMLRNAIVGSTVVDNGVFHDSCVAIINA